MELTNVELTAVSEAANQTADSTLVALSELQLTLVGGGCGDVIVV